MQGRAEIFNSDQGVPSTSLAFTRVLREAVIAISKEGRGRALDNVFVERLWRTVKYEDIDPKGYASMAELHMGLTDYFDVLPRGATTPSAEQPHTERDSPRRTRGWSGHRGPFQGREGDH